MYGLTRDFGYEYNVYPPSTWIYGYDLEDYGYWYSRLEQFLNEDVAVVVRSGRGYEAVSGVLGRVYSSYILLINGYTVMEIPINRIVAVRKLPEDAARTVEQG